MTEYILRKLKKEGEDRENPRFRARVGFLSGLVGIIFNALLALMKLAVGTVSGSLSITADAMNNFSDATSSIVSMIGFHLAERPADRNHPYGHARFEYLSGLAVAVMVIIIGFELSKSSLGKIVHPERMSFSPYVAVVLVLSIAVKFLLYIFNIRLGRKIDSQPIIATAEDSRNDCISTFAVLASALIEFNTGVMIDGWMGLVVSVIIVISGIRLGIETISPLLGEAANPELQRDIKAIMKTCPEVLGVHDLLVHDYGPGQRFASLHVEMDSRMEPLSCHEMIDDLERKCLEEKNVHLVIHWDPVVVGDRETDRMKRETLRVLEKFDPRLSLHDFRMVKGEGHTNVIFDVPLPDDMRDRQEEIKERIEETLGKIEGRKIYAVITFDQENFNS